MSALSRQTLDLWLRGDLDAAASALVEHAVLHDPEVGSLLESMLDEASGLATTGATDPFRSREQDPEGPAARALRSATSILAARRERDRVLTVIAAAAAAAALAVGLWIGLGPPSEPAFAALTDELCATARLAGTVPLYTTLDCGLVPDMHLGDTPPSELTRFRLTLDGDRRPSDLDWLAARSLVGLLEGRGQDVVDLLGDSPALIAHPALHADLAAACAQLGPLMGTPSERVFRY